MEQNITDNNIDTLEVSNGVSTKVYPKEVHDIISVDGYNHVIVHEFENSKIIIASESTERNIMFLNKARSLPDSGYIGGKFTSFGY